MKIVFSTYRYVFANSRIWKVFFIIAFLFLYCYSCPQDTLLTLVPDDPGINSIRFIRKFPDYKEEAKDGIFNRIGEFFWGKSNEVNLSKPISIFAENSDVFWVSDQGVGSLIKIQDGVGEIPHCLKEKYLSLVGLCVSSTNELFFTESGLNKLFKISPDKDQLSEFKTSIALDQPTGVAFSKIKDEIWVVETGAHRITVFDLDGEVVRQIGERGQGPGEFNYPTFIWIDKSGFVYIVDSMNFRIQILNDEGEVISTFGQIGDVSGYFSRPKGIATDSYGNIYVVDALFHVVQIFDREGQFLYHFGGQGRKDGQFWMPTGIFIDENDYIYVADSYNSRIQIFQLITSNK